MRFFYYSRADAAANLTAQSRTQRSGDNDTVLWVRENSHSYSWKRAEVTFSSTINSKVRKKPMLGVFFSVKLLIIKRVVFYLLWFFFTDCLSLGTWRRTQRPCCSRWHFFLSGLSLRSTQLQTARHISHFSPTVLHERSHLSNLRLTCEPLPGKRQARNPME